MKKQISKENKSRWDSRIYEWLLFYKAEALQTEYHHIVAW